MLSVRERANRRTVRGHLFSEFWRSKISVKVSNKTLTTEGRLGWGLVPSRHHSGKKGSNSRAGRKPETTRCWLAGFDVKDVHMTDLISGERWKIFSLSGAVGGFSNSDVLGSAKGGAFWPGEKQMRR
jgi:hypothetical protein